MLTIINILSCFSSERPHEPEASQTSFKESPTRVSTAQTSQSSNSKLSTTENQLTFHLSTKGITLRGRSAYTYYGGSHIPKTAIFFSSSTLHGFRFFLKTETPLIFWTVGKASDKYDCTRSLTGGGGGGRGRGLDSPIKMTGCSSYLLEVKICRLVPLRVLKYKMTPGKVILVSFRVLRKK